MPSKAKALASALEKFDAKFKDTYGSTSIDTSGEIVPYEVISSGCLSLDYAMGVGGYVEGRLTEIWGQESIGKSTLALQACREAQRKHPDKAAAWIDMEHTFDKPWAITHGMDITPNRFRLIIPDSAEFVADQMKDCLRSGLFSIVVLDSIGAMIPEAEKEKDADQATMAIQAKIVTRMVKIATVEAHNSSTVVLMINQVRANLGYGADTTTGGGFALKHVTTHKLKLSRTGTSPFTVKVPGEAKPVEVGHEVAVMIEKNKVAPSRRRAQFVLFTSSTDKYGPAGIDVADDVTTMGLRTKVIIQSGAWYSLPDGTRLQGRESVVEALRGDPSLVGTIRDQALATLAPEVVVGEEGDPLTDPETKSILDDLGLPSESKFGGTLTTDMAEEI